MVSQSGYQKKSKKLCVGSVLIQFIVLTSGQKNIHQTHTYYRDICYGETLIFHLRWRNIKTTYCFVVTSNVSRRRRITRKNKNE